MLTQREKRDVFNSFPELIEMPISNGRFDYRFEGSSKRHKNVGGQLSTTGNCYVLGKFIPGCDTDTRGWVNVKDYSAAELKAIIKQAIESLR